MKPLSGSCIDYLQPTPCLPLPRKHSPDGATTDWWWRQSNCSLLFIYRLRKDERLSWPSWLTYSGRFTHISGYPSAVGRAQDRESSPVRDQRSIPLRHANQLLYSNIVFPYRHKNKISRLIFWPTLQLITAKLPSTMSLAVDVWSRNTAFTSPSSAGLAMLIASRWVNSSARTWYLGPGTTSTPATYHVTGTFWWLTQHSKMAFSRSRTLTSSSGFVNSNCSPTNHNKRIKTRMVRWMLNVSSLMDSVKPQTSVQHEPCHHCAAATVSDNRWKRTYFVVITQHTQRSRDASWLCAI